MTKWQQACTADDPVAPNKLWWPRRSLNTHVSPAANVRKWPWLYLADESWGQLRVPLHPQNARDKTIMNNTTGQPFSVGGLETRGGACMHDCMVATMMSSFSLSGTNTGALYFFNCCLFTTLFGGFRTLWSEPRLIPVL